MWVPIILAALILSAILVCKRASSSGLRNPIPLEEQELRGKWVTVGWTHELKFASEADKTHAIEWSRGRLFGLYERGDWSSCLIRVAGRTIQVLEPHPFYRSCAFPPSFPPGQRVCTIPGARGRTPRESVVQAVEHHNKRNQWIYYLRASSGRRANRWYYEDELKKIGDAA